MNGQASTLDAGAQKDDMENGTAGLEQSVERLANAITPFGAMRGTDAAGGSVGSLTEAVIGITAGLFRIAEAIDGLADAVRDAEPNDVCVSQAIDGLTNAVRDRG